jgi:3-deoxy-D-manno-octulosonate 8-phosphate phosphatase (KDO 8-P phosphatase)
MYLCAMQKESYLKKLHQIKALVFDVDGIFTNNQLIAAESGDLLRSFNARDGFALKTAIEKGFNICIITAGTSPAVRKRFEMFGIKHIYDRVSNKLKVLESFLSEENLLSEEVLYMGDDIPDYYAMKTCGLKCCPKDAVPEIQNISDYVCARNGGDTCVREVIEMVLKVQGKWFEEM